ncbi:MAG: glutamine--fructose-6-phosphate transaminase (isomerizing) [Anderseniella sp.]|nr:glutamine--fructose-6-phosphate transaminase (isomerizing) [Anderseniella sp.]
MCGIVGILGSQPVAPLMLDALRRLEYRGYDSAGIATLEDGELMRQRAPGKLNNLQGVLASRPLAGTTGIGHTRWATHGAPTENNAHPHAAKGVAVVHNGIIENFRELREELEQAGCDFETETDTEVIVQMISCELADGKSPVDAVKATLKRLDGAFALGIIFSGEQDLMIGARRGSPLAVGHGEAEMFLGSDAVALAPFTNKVTFLDEGDWVVLTRKSVHIFDENGAPVKRPVRFTKATAYMADKGNHRHFMAKEIAEQPEVIGHTLGEYIDMGEKRVKLPDLPFNFAGLSRLTITACGTAYYAGLAAKYWFEQVARLPVDIDIASEFRYREAPLAEGGLSVVISQSGETADTLAALRYCAEQGQHTLGIVNVQDSSIARDCDAIMPTYAGPEIGVASTKAFTCQLTVLACLALAAARDRNTITAERERELVSALLKVPRQIADMLRHEDDLKRIAKKLTDATDVLFLGRGINYPIALEGALKLKEISYIHAEGYAAGELKHGPIALIDKDVRVIVIAPHDALYEKTVSNMEEVAARGAKIVLLTDEINGNGNGSGTFEQFRVPKANAFVNPILYAVPVQLLAYHAAVFMGTDIDQPRNLAKSVTVE